MGVFRARLAALLFLAACGNSVLCTSIGCNTGVAIDFRGFSPPPSALPVKVTICVNGACDDSPLTDVVSRSLPGLGGSGKTLTALVSATVRGANGVVLTSMAEQAAPLERRQPNGPRCAPTCYLIGMRYDGQSGAIVLIPNPTAP